MYATGAKISRSARPICFFKTRYYEETVPFWGIGACTFKSEQWRGGYGRINGGTWVLELATESREAPLGYGARSTSTGMLTSNRLKGDNMTQATIRTAATGGAARFGGGVCERISRRRKTRYGGFE
jgi:hypothetical protein